MITAGCRPRAVVADDSHFMRCVISGDLVGAVLTGMGDDGAEGICQIKEAGGRTLAHDEATSAVYGMPKRAFETGWVDRVLPIEDAPAGILDGIRREVT